MALIATTLTGAECRPWQQDLKAQLVQTMSDVVQGNSSRVLVDMEGRVML